MMSYDGKTSHSKQEQLERVLGMKLTNSQIHAISVGWTAFYDEPEAYANGIIVDCVKRFLK